MSVRTNMRLGERTQADFTNFPISSEQSRIQPYYHVNDISQSKQSSFPSKFPYHQHSRSYTNSYPFPSKQTLQDKYNKIKTKYQQLCKQNQQLKAKTLHFQNALNSYKASPFSAQSKRLKLHVNTNTSSLSQTKTKSSSDYRTKDIIDKMAKTEFYGDIGTPHDIYNTIKDKVLERSLYLYPNKNCHTCAQCFTVGLSSYKCPKCHHLQVI